MQATYRRAHALTAAVLPRAAFPGPRTCVRTTFPAPAVLLLAEVHSSRHELCSRRVALKWSVKQSSSWASGSVRTSSNACEVALQDLVGGRYGGAVLAAGIPYGAGTLWHVAKISAVQSAHPACSGEATPWARTLSLDNIGHVSRWKCARLQHSYCRPGSTATA